ncbi:hypothetical protein [Paenibacillus fonticola]|nr:hypothetical protein [Paenibacillus fonticola]
MRVVRVMELAELAGLLTRNGQVIRYLLKLDLFRYATDTGSVIRPNGLQ